MMKKINHSRHVFYYSQIGSLPVLQVKTFFLSINVSTGQVYVTGIQNN